MELSGLNLWLLAGGGALLLLLLMLRFALRPRKKVVAKPGLGLDTGSNSLWGRPEGWKSITAGKSEIAAAAAPPGGSLSDRPESKPASYRETVGESAATTEMPPVAGMPFVAPATEPQVAAASARAAESRADVAGAAAGAAGTCPKCGGRFLQGEMEGPTLMIDGVAREDFQPLLSARECTDCGYLEFYTRASRS